MATLFTVLTYKFTTNATLKFYTPLIVLLLKNGDHSSPQINCYQWNSWLGCHLSNTLRHMTHLWTTGADSNGLEVLEKKCFFLYLILVLKCDIKVHRVRWSFKRGSCSGYIWLCYRWTQRWQRRGTHWVWHVELRRPEKEINHKIK